MAKPLPTYAELLDMLDNVSAALASVMAAHGKDMSVGDRVTRGCLADAARELCDELLRAEPDWVALAKDAGYDGSPGGEKEWCISHGMASYWEEE